MPFLSLNRLRQSIEGVYVYRNYVSSYSNITHCTLSKFGSLSAFKKSLECVNLNHFITVYKFPLCVNVYTVFRFDFC